MKKELTPEDRKLLEDVSRPGWVKEEFARLMAQKPEPKKPKKKRKRTIVIRSNTVN